MTKLAIGILSIPLALALVPMNRFYGVRTPKTLSDSHVWFSANRFGGWLLLLSSVVYLVFSAVCPMKRSLMGKWLHSTNREDPPSISFRTTNPCGERWFISCSTF